jgi:hypothetical protein
MKTTKLLFAVMVSMMLLTTACGKSGGSNEAAGSGGGISENCSNCSGFVAGPTVFSGNVSGNSGYSIQGLSVAADKNSLATIYSNNPRMTGTYQGIPTGGTFIANGTSSCIPNGSYSIQGLQVGMISPDLTTQSISPMWVTLSGPATFKIPMYIKLVDTNGDDMGDTGTTVYLWFQCNGGWSQVGMSAL